MDLLEQYIKDAIVALPERIRKAMSNVAFVIEDEPKDRKALLGLYHGIPKTKRGQGYTMVLPDKITIYRKMIEEEAGATEKIPRVVRRVVWHEIGHHFGFEEKDIRRLERKWEKEKKV